MSFAQRGQSCSFHLIKPMSSELSVDVLCVGRRGSATSPVPQDRLFPLVLPMLFLSPGYSLSLLFHCCDRVP